MSILIVFLISIVLYHFIEKLNRKFQFGREKNVEEDRKIHSKKDVSRIGGVVFFSIIYLIFIIDDLLIQQIIIYGLIVLILGLIEDLKSDIPTSLRVLNLLILISIFVITNEFIIQNFNLYLIDNLFLSCFLLFYLFSIFGFLFLINGFNFIDGLNGLVLGYTLIILIFYCYFSYIRSDSIYVLCASLLVSVLILFYHNFLFSRILTGDGGSYSLGFLIGAISIYFANNNILPSTSIAIILFYPFMEALFTPFKRHYILKDNVFKSDSFHLHQILYRIILKSKYVEKLNLKIENINSFTSSLILSIITTMLIIGLFLSKYINAFLIFITYCALYLIFYYILYKFEKRNYPNMIKE